MRSTGSAGQTNSRPNHGPGSAANTPPPDPTGASPPASGTDGARARGSQGDVPAGGELRTKEWAGRIRRYYGEVFCPAVNHPADPRHFPALRRDSRRGKRRSEDDLSVRVCDDPDHPVTRVARTITEVVQGEEDEDWEVCEARARYLLLVLAKYPIVVEPSLHLGYPTSALPAPDAPADGGDQGSRSQPRKPPILHFGFEDTRWVRLHLSLEASRDASWNSSAWLLQEFIRYELFYKGRLLRLGVCHNPMCERLYVKAKHAGSTQSFCNRACGDAARRQRQEP